MFRKLARVGQAYREDGLAETMRLIGLNLAELPGRWWLRLRKSEFDRRYGTDTSDPVYHSELDSPPDRRRAGTWYQVTSVEGFRDMMRQVAVEPAAYSFLDIGAGKGRVLMLAAGLPFRRVLGVELAPGLVRIAERNLARLPRSEHRSGPVACLCADATVFPVPDGPLLVYLFNPFGEPVMGEFLAHLEAAWRRAPRPIVLVYANPRLQDRFDRAAWLARTHEGSFATEAGERFAYLIYRAG